MSSPSLKPLFSGFFFVFVVADTIGSYILTDIHNNGAVDMAEQRVNCYIKFKKSAKEKVQAIADRDHGGNFHAALHKVIEDSKA